MTAPEKILYTAEASATGGRQGHAASSDDRLVVDLSVPKALGGDDGPGTNPEQLFAAGYAACFLGAVKLVGRTTGVKIDDNAKITARVGIGPVDGGYALTVELMATLPGLDPDTAQTVLEGAHQRCPYSNATRGNIDVKLSVA